MRAVTIDGYGGRDRLTIADLPDPEPAPGEVLVRIQAAALNRMDTFIRRGLTGPGVRQPRALPHVLGAEGAGVVVDSSRAETDLVAGDRVLVYPGLSCHQCAHCRRGQNSRCRFYGIRGEDEWGLQRELAAVPARDLVSVADEVEIEGAAASPVGYTTAWTLLVSAARLQVGERVLVIGGSGGVAIAAMQLADHAGAEVWATTRSPEKAKRLSTLPFVHHVVDSAQAGWSADVLERTSGRGVDVVVDSVGAPTWPDAIRSLAPGGRLAVCGATGGDSPDISIRELYQSHRQVVGGPFGGWADFEAAISFTAQAQLSPLVHASLPLDQVAEAHRIIEDNEHVGKIVLRP